MKIRFWIIFLALANMAFWLWLYANSDLSQREPDRLRREFNADKITVLANASIPPATAMPNSATVGVETVAVPPPLTSTEAPPLTPVVVVPKLMKDAPSAVDPSRALAAAPAVPSTAPAPATVTPVAPARPVNKTVVVKNIARDHNPVADGKNSCLRVGAFAANETKPFQQILQKLKLKTYAKTVLGKKSEHFVIFVGPYKTQKLAQQELQKLKSKASYAQLSSGAPWQIILGSFTQKEAAQAGQKRLANVGVKGKISAIGASEVNFDLSGLNATQSQQLKATVKKLRKANVRPCP